MNMGNKLYLNHEKWADAFYVNQLINQVIVAAPHELLIYKDVFITKIQA